MPRKAKEDILLTTAQLAKRWQMTADHLEIKRMRGEGPEFVKLGEGPRAPVRYRLEVIQEYEKKNERSSTKPPPAQPTL